MIAQANVVLPKQLFKNSLIINQYCHIFTYIQYKYINFGAYILFVIEYSKKRHILKHFPFKRKNIPEI